MKETEGDQARANGQMSKCAKQKIEGNFCLALPQFNSVWLPQFARQFNRLIEFQGLVKTTMMTLLLLLLLQFPVVAGAAFFFW